MVVNTKPVTILMYVIGFCMEYHYDIKFYIILSSSLEADCTTNQQPVPNQVEN